MLVSYLITSHNETNSLEKLLSTLIKFKGDAHEIVLIDDYSDNLETISIIQKYKLDIRIYYRKLDRDYGTHKNFGIEQCMGKWIFQLDADEYPTNVLLDNIDEILKLNDNTDVIWLPRLNIFNGVTDVDIKMWGWQYKDGLINFPDFQSRIFKNVSNIRYKRRLHEKVEGYKSYMFIPPQKDIAIIHEKTIEKQRETNLNYNKLFTSNENMGYSVK